MPIRLTKIFQILAAVFCATCLAKLFGNKETGPVNRQYNKKWTHHYTMEPQKGHWSCGAGWILEKFWKRIEAAQDRLWGIDRGKKNKQKLVPKISKSRKNY